MTQKIGIIGQGGWGKALAAVQQREGRVLGIHTRETPNIAALKDCDIVLVTTPAQALRSYMTELAPDLPPDATYILCCKGIELATGKLLSDVMRDVLGDAAKIAVLSGPNFASEVSAGMPAACTIAAKENALELVARLGTRSFRAYASDDIVGAQIGGALKNVIAIACGMVTGAGLGENARAALMTRGLAEMVRIATALGGQRATLMGMCGFGDLVLSASSPSSRNYALGYRIGQAGMAKDVLVRNQSLTEGVATAAAARALCTAHGIDAPTIDAVCRIVTDGESFATVMQDLMARPFKSEI